MSWELARFMAGRVIDDAGADPRTPGRGTSICACSRAGPRQPNCDLRRRRHRRFRRTVAGAPGQPTTADAPRAANAQWLALANFCPRDSELRRVRLYRLRNAMPSNTRRDFFSTLRRRPPRRGAGHAAAARTLRAPTLRARVLRRLQLRSRRRIFRPRPRRSSISS